MGWVEYLECDVALLADLDHDQEPDSGDHQEQGGEQHCEEHLLPP